MERPEANDPWLSVVEYLCIKAPWKELIDPEPGCHGSACRDPGRQCEKQAGNGRVRTGVQTGWIELFYCQGNGCSMFISKDMCSWDSISCLPKGPNDSGLLIRNLGIIRTPFRLPAVFCHLGFRWSYPANRLARLSNRNRQATGTLLILQFFFRVPGSQWKSALCVTLSLHVLYAESPPSFDLEKAEPTWES